MNLTPEIVLSVEDLEDLLEGYTNAFNENQKV